MSRAKMIRMLRKPDMGASETHGTNGILARLWKKILQDLNILPMEWNRLMIAYVRDHRNKVPNTRRDHSSVLGNLTKELIKPSMTWRIFCKGLRFLRLTKFEITITAHHLDGAVTVHSMPVDLYESMSDEEFDDKG